MEKYQDINAKTIDSWNKEGWQWGKPISHAEYVKALQGEFNVLLTPTKFVPSTWFLPFKGLKLLGLASGGGQQMPIFAALGAECIVFDYSLSQLESEEMVAKREGYNITIIRGDMSQPLPFKDGEFDFVFNPVSTCYIQDVKPLFKEVYRILRKGGVFVAGFDNGINYLFSEDETRIENVLPYNPLKNKKQYAQAMQTNDGIQFSHTLEELIGGQLEAGFTLTDIFEDTNGEGMLHEHNVKSFIATRCVK